MIDIKEILSKKYGYLTPLSEIKYIKGVKRFIKCICICGNIKDVYLARLRNGETRSCGCFQKKIMAKIGERNSIIFLGKNNPNYKHGDTHTRFHGLFLGITGRCNIKSYSNYSYYGGRGIKCLWKDYLMFKKDMYKSYLLHVKKHGENQTTIDRIDNNKNYCKENCKWSTKKEQANNKRNNIK